MPDIQAPPIPKDADLEKLTQFFSKQEPEDYHALKLVRSTFERYESWRKVNIEPKWEQNERLYHGVLAERKWKGSSINRAAISSRLIFDQVEAAYPLITEALFEQQPAFFDIITPDKPAEGAAYRDRLYGYLARQYSPEEPSGIAQMKMAIHQALIYNNCAVEVGYDDRNKRPYVEWVDIRELYFDPLARGPLADSSPSIIRRRMMRVEDLADLEGLAGVNMPSEEVLNYFAKSYQRASADQVFQNAALAQKLQLDPGHLAVDPMHQTIEVLQYWTAKRMIWVIGRLWVMINRENTMGFMPFGIGTPRPIEGRLYGLSIPEVLRDDQTYATGIRCARLDNLALSLNRPRKKMGDSPVGPKEESLWPGKVERVNDLQGFELLEVENVTQTAFTEEALIEQRAARRFGINEMVMSGVPQPSNANRTATGVSRQMQATGSRLKAPVEAFETFFIMPTMYKIHAIMRRFDTNIPDSAELRMDAASRMIQRERLASFIGPVSQHVFNPQIMAEAAKTGMAFDFMEWNRFFKDATGTGQIYNFWRQATPQEQQMRNAPDPKVQAEMQQKQQELQARMALGKMKSDTELKTTQIETEGKLQETGEKSAREVLKLLATPKDKGDKDGSKRSAGSSKNK